MNCPNCGAPLKGGTCEYCGTLTEVPLSVMLGKKVSIVFEYDGRKVGFDTVIDGLEINDEGYADSFYAFGGNKVHTIWNPRYTMDLRGTLVPQQVADKGYVLMTETIKA